MKHSFHGHNYNLLKAEHSLTWANFPINLQPTTIRYEDPIFAPTKVADLRSNKRSFVYPFGSTPPYKLLILSALNTSFNLILSF